MPIFQSANDVPDTDAIIFYDIPGNVEGKAWSPNTWKTRLGHFLLLFAFLLKA